MLLRFTHRALEDLVSISRYIHRASGNRAIARGMAEALREQCEKLAALPGTIGRPRDDLLPGLRSFPFRGYVIIFSYESDTLLVVRVLHGQRDIAAQLGGDAGSE